MGALMVTAADLIGDTPRWQAAALCKETYPDAFFPEKGESPLSAKRICGRCPVTDECLDWALGNNERWGIWGGLSDAERRKIQRRGA